MYKRIAICLIVAATLVGLAASASAAATLVARYNFEAGTGTAVADSSGNNLDLAIEGPVTWSTDVDTPKYGVGTHSLAFTDGLTGKVVGQSGSTNPLNFGSGSFSVSFLLKQATAATGTQTTYMCKGSQSGNDFVTGSLGARFRVLMKATLFYCELDAGDSFGSASGKTQFDLVVAPTNGDYNLLSGSWEHLVIAIDRTSATHSMNFFVDGTARTPAQHSGNPFTNTDGLSLSDLGPMVIGNYILGNSESDNQSFSGNLDDVRLYSGVLTEADVVGMYVTPATPPGGGPAGANHWEIYY